MEIQTIKDFRKWVLIQLILQETSEKKLAEKMGTVHTRISEAINGKPTGRKYIIPLIHALGGDINNFTHIL